MIEIISEDNKYKTISLVKRENINCSVIDKETFIKYITEDMNIAYNNYEEYSRNINCCSFSYADFDVNPKWNGGSYCITIDNCERTADNCFNDCKDNYYFKAIKGWQITCKTNNKRIAFRPEFVFKFDDDIQKQYKDDQIFLANDIARFYSDCPCN